VNPAEKKLQQFLINLTNGFSYQDFIKYRKDRNWVKYDASTPIERLLMIVREVKEFKNGYFDDENLFENENNNDDNYY
jgi:hypothetical protein